MNMFLGSVVVGFGAILVVGAVLRLRRRARRGGSEDAKDIYPLW